MEYNPNLFSMYESDASSEKSLAAVGDDNLLHYGKFERKNVQAGHKDPQATLSVFLVASVLEAKNRRLLKEAKGLDDVVKVSLSLSLSLSLCACVRARVRARVCRCVLACIILLTF